MDDDKRTKEELLEEIEALKDEVDKFRLIETIFRQIERELRIKNKAISSSINPIIFCDLEGKINYVNAAFLEAWRYSYDSEIFGANVLELFFKDQARDELERIISDHGSWQGALSAKKKGGEGFFVQGALAPIKDDEGNEVCIMASFTDISLIKEKERNLLEAKDFLNSLINAIPEPVFVKDEEHKWVLLNDEVCERIGRSREELIGKSDYDIFPKEQADIFWEKDDQVFREGGTLVNEETIVFDGKNRIISTVKTLCEDDVTGRKIIIGTIRDITEGKLLENLLKESEKRYRALVEGVNQPIVRLKEDGTVLFLNNFAALELGGKPDDFTGRNILELFPEEPA
ncbi:MAG: PAS domain S-box protein, partial [Candidatus Omnitrophica bacterium]|nr:PAS domain S-box protein [Candidatus Omnitrophota bacterium]